MEFTEESQFYEMVNAIFAMPSIADATLIYSVGFTLVITPFLMAWAVVCITKAIKLISHKET